MNKMKEQRIGYRIKCPVCNNKFLETTDENNELIIASCHKCYRTIDILTHIGDEYVRPIYKKEV